MGTCRIYGSCAVNISDSIDYTPSIFLYNNYSEGIKRYYPVPIDGTPSTDVLQVDYEMQSGVDYSSSHFFDTKTKRIVLLGMNPDHSDFVFITKNPKTFSTITRTVGIGRDTLGNIVPVVKNIDKSLYAFMLTGYSGTTRTSAPAIYIYNARTGVLLTKELQDITTYNTTLKSLYYDEVNNQVFAITYFVDATTPYNTGLKSYIFNLTSDEVNCAPNNTVLLRTAVSSSVNFSSDANGKNYQHFGIILRESDNYGRKIWIYDYDARQANSYTITDTYIPGFRSMIISDDGFVSSIFTGSGFISASVQKTTFAGAVSTFTAGTGGSADSNLYSLKESFGIKITYINNAALVYLLNTNTPSSTELTLVKSETGLNEIAPYTDFLQGDNYFVISKSGATATYRRYTNLFSYNSNTPTVIDLSNNSNYTSGLTGLPLAFITE